jgi:2-haloacid dehalogenase/putative hydrolase of the HAD superfamily
VPLVYAAVLLDVYGTMVRDDDDFMRSICFTVAGLAGVEPDLVHADWNERLYAMADVAYGDGFRLLSDLNAGSLAETLDHFGVTADAEALCVAQVRSWRTPPMFDDAAQFLTSVAVPVCLVSDADRAVLDAVLRSHGITVDAVVTSEDARAYKPRAEPFLMALDRLGVGPADVVHIGDSPSTDVAGAAALGIDSVLLNRTGRPLPPGVTPTYEVDTLLAVPIAGR